MIKGSSQNYDSLIEHSLDKKEIQQLLELVSQHFSAISINLYSGKVWFAEHFDKWVQEEVAITGEIPTIQDLAFVLQKENFHTAKLKTLLCHFHLTTLSKTMNRSIRLVIIPFAFFNISISLVLTDSKGECANNLLSFL